MKILPDIASAWAETKAKKVKAFPQNNLRASSVGHPCARLHYHSIVNWQDKTLHDYILQSIFDEGFLHEKDVVSQLGEMGFQVVEQQRSFQIDKPLITGHLDGMVVYGDERYPFDVKSMNGHDFDKLSSSDDFINSKRIYHRNYIAQLQLYLLMSGNEHGCLILKNKTTGEIKDVWLKLNFDFCESILKMAEKVYLAIKAGTPPERIDDYDVCKDCKFKHVCLPDLKIGTGTYVLEESEWLERLNRREELEAFRKEYDEIDAELSELRDRLGKGEFVCGSYLFAVKQYEKKIKVMDTWHEEKKLYLTKKIVRVQDE